MPDGGGARGLAVLGHHHLDSQSLSTDPPSSPGAWKEEGELLSSLRGSGLGASDLRGWAQNEGNEIRGTHRGGGARRDVEEWHSALGAVRKREVFWD